MYICMCTQGIESPVQATLQGMAGLAQVYVYIQQEEHVQARCSKNKQLASANHCASGPEANRIHGFTTDKAPIRQPAVCIVEKAGTVYHTAHIRQLCGRLILCTGFRSQYGHGRDQNL